MEDLKLFLNKNRYLLASLLLFALMTVSSTKIDWAGDFWEHSAVVRELSTNTLNPKHPLLFSEKDHPFFSPYLLLVSLFTKTFSINPICSLSIFGIFIKNFNASSTSMSRMSAIFSPL